MGRHVRLTAVPLSSRNLLAATFLLASAGALDAQQRRQLPTSDPQAQVMGYYAAIMEFTPVGLAEASGRWEIGGSLGFIPALSAEDRAVGFGGTKLEDTNRCPVFPRLTAARSFGAVAVEGGWTPPITVCGVQANIGALAVSYRLGAPAAAWNGVVRAATTVGTLDAAITCGEDDIADPANQTCYAGSLSDDRVAPLTLSMQAALVWNGGRRRHIEPYLLVGVGRHRMHFDVNYARAASNAGNLPALDDHERLAATLTRMHAAVGASWAPAGRLRLGGELYGSPGAVITLRARAAVALGSDRAR